MDRALKSSEVEKRFQGLGPQTLRPAVVESLFSAYDLHARGTFFAKTKVKNIIRQDGAILLALGSDKWQGYHWIGLAAEGGPQNKEARACFENSVRIEPVANKDQINLAELLFLDGRYDEAAVQANKYAASEYNRVASPADMVALFYLVAANRLASKKIPGAMNPEQFMNKLKGLPNLSLEGTFLSEDLENALDKSRPEGDMFKVQDAAKKDDVRKMKDCFTQRKC